MLSGFEMKKNKSKDKNNVVLFWEEEKIDKKTKHYVVLFRDCFWGNLLSPPVSLSLLQLSRGKLMGYFHSFIHSFEKKLKAKLNKLMVYFHSFKKEF